MYSKLFTLLVSMPPLSGSVGSCWSVSLSSEPNAIAIQRPSPDSQRSCASP
jgi:hypothetical protein